MIACLPPAAEPSVELPKVARLPTVVVVVDGVEPVAGVVTVLVPAGLTGGIPHPVNKIAVAAQEAAQPMAVTRLRRRWRRTLGT
jgi:hypothetical protein